MIDLFRPLRAAAVLVGLFGGAACNQTAGPATPPAAPATASAGGAAASIRLPEGAGCSGEVARYRAVLANDLATGHVAKSVHERVAREVDEAASACAAGRDGEAVRIIGATKARFGYR